MSNKNFQNKYNFNYDEQERITNEILSTIKPLKRYNYELPLLNNYKNMQLRYIRTPLTFEDRITMKKIHYDSLTSSQILKKKVILNFKLIKMFFDNFYLDDFNKTRASVYIFFTVPFLVGASFYMLSPVHPIRGLAFNLSILITFINLVYNYVVEMDELYIQDNSLSNEVNIL